jgi:ketosteroid isomerase-like protein
MASLAKNKATVLAFIESLSRGQPDEGLLCDDATWWVPGMGTLSRAQFFALSDAFQDLVKAPATMIVVAVTAEQDRVAVEANGEAELKDGRLYSNTYHFLFHLRDGKIAQAREHNNSAVPAALFGNTLTRQAR